MKIILIFIFTLLIFKKINIKKENIPKIKFNNLNMELNLTKNLSLKQKIRIGIYCNSIKNGGIERLTSLLITYLNKVKIFNIFLFSQIKENNEYFIPKDTNRIIIKFGIFKNLIREAMKNKIDIMIYQFYNIEEMNILNKISNFKTIFYNHSCFLHWIYINDYNLFINLYDAYKQSKYVISLIPFENDYLFKEWGIKSILMNNFISYEYNQIKPSNLTSKIIIMIGRADDQMKRLELGIFAMKFIIKEIECEMKIISKIDERNNLKKLVKGLNLEKYIKFLGYTSTPEIYFKNASLHIFPTISESFGLVLCETKIYGIPNILLGLDYVSFANGGTVIIYNDEPETIAKEAIKILKNERYRNKLGQEARESMKKLRNIVTIKKWIKLLLAVYNGENYYKELIYQDKKISEVQAINIIKRQLILLKKRKKNYTNFTLNNIKNFTFIKNFLFFN